MPAVILLKDVDTLGEQGDIIQVAEGFARNYLMPNQLAVVATEGAKADRERRLHRITARADKRLAEAKAKASKIEAIGVLTIAARAGDEGKLFGAITTRELAIMISEKTGMEIDHRLVTTNTAVRHIGSFSAIIKLSHKVTANLPIDVIRDEA
ncbi:MAG: 50S ribosomal protein L9 [Vampirovibrionales bacterium]|nr:50S ribosomal protein L9 [Vampirovibrionales bacterium]